MFLSRVSVYKPIMNVPQRVCRAPMNSLRKRGGHPHRGRTGPGTGSPECVRQLARGYVPRRAAGFVVEGFLPSVVRVLGRAEAIEAELGALLVARGNGGFWGGGQFQMNAQRCRGTEHVELWRLMASQVLGSCTKCRRVHLGAVFALPRPRNCVNSGRASLHIPLLSYSFPRVCLPCHSSASPVVPPLSP